MRTLKKQYLWLWCHLVQNEDSGRRHAANSRHGGEETHPCLPENTHTHTPHTKAQSWLSECQDWIQQLLSLTHALLRGSVCFLCLTWWPWGRARHCTGRRWWTTPRWSLYQDTQRLSWGPACLCGVKQFSYEGCVCNVCIYMCVICLSIVMKSISVQYHHCEDILSGPHKLNCLFEG